MKSWLSFLACVLLSLVLSACGRSQTVLDRVYVKNATNSRITDVRVRHEPTERYGSVCYPAAQVLGYRFFGASPSHSQGLCKLAR